MDSSILPSVRATSQPELKPVLCTHPVQPSSLRRLHMTRRHRERWLPGSSDPLLAEAAPNLSPNNTLVGAMFCFKASCFQYSTSYLSSLHQGYRFSRGRNFSTRRMPAILHSTLRAIGLQRVISRSEQVADVEGAIPI